MADLRVSGARDVHGELVEVTILDGLVAATAPSVATVGPDLPAYDAGGLTVLPGLVDLQVNGVAGIDLTLEPERLWELAAALPRFGVTAFLPTVITSAPAARDRALRTLAEGPPDGWVGAEPLGLHFEGPMISPHRLGAHPEQWLRPPARDLVADWSLDAGVTMVTIAPELPGALDVIATLVERGIVVAVGHTEASAAQVHAAADRGATHATHLGNAMASLAGRDPGPVGATLADDRLTAGVIADGHHLHPDTLAVFRRALGPDRMLAVTDCTAALGLPDGAARLGDQHVQVREGTVRLEDGTLAGSAADLPQCLRVLRSDAGLALPAAVATCTSVAASVIGDPARGRIAAGARGDLTLVDDDLAVVATVVAGRVVLGGA